MMDSLGKPSTRSRDQGNTGSILSSNTRTRGPVSAHDRSSPAGEEEVGPDPWGHTPSSAPPPPLPPNYQYSEYPKQPRQLPKEGSQTRFEAIPYPDQVELGDKHPFSNLEAGAKYILESKRGPDRKWICKFCNRTFARKSHIETHEQTVHLKLRPYKCQFCLRSFGQKIDRHNHEITVHLQTVPFECRICHRKLSRRSYLYDHERTHGVEPSIYCCRVEGCVEGFTSQELLAGHYEQHHPGQLTPVAVPVRVPLTIRDDGKAVGSTPEVKITRKVITVVHTLESRREKAEEVEKRKKERAGKRLMMEQAKRELKEARRKEKAEAAQRKKEEAEQRRIERNAKKEREQKEREARRKEREAEKVRAKEVRAEATKQKKAATAVLKRTRASSVSESGKGSKDAARNTKRARKGTATGKQSTKGSIGTGDDEGPWICTRCEGLEFVDSDSYSRHSKIHAFTCHGCPATFASREHMTSHAGLLHPAHPFPVSGTKRDLKTYKAAQLALWKGSDPPDLHCKYCHTYFDIPEARDLHEQYAHTHEEKDQCQYCGGALSQEDIEDRPSDQIRGHCFMSTLARAVAHIFDPNNPSWQDPKA